jgi:hypothetical protein
LINITEQMATLYSGLPNEIIGKIFENLADQTDYQNFSQACKSNHTFFNDVTTLSNWLFKKYKNCALVVALNCLNVDEDSTQPCVEIIRHLLTDATKHFEFNAKVSAMCVLRQYTFDADAYECVEVLHDLFDIPYNYITDDNNIVNQEAIAKMRDIIFWASDGHPRCLNELYNFADFLGFNILGNSPRDALYRSVENGHIDCVRVTMSRFSNNNYGLFRLLELWKVIFRALEVDQPDIALVMLQMCGRVYQHFTRSKMLKISICKGFDKCVRFLMGQGSYLAENLKADAKSDCMFALERLLRHSYGLRPV